MRRISGLISILLLALVLAGCGRSSLQQEVDEANLRQLNRVISRYYVLMVWDQEPKEWLMLSDSGAGAMGPGTYHALLTFYGQRMSVASHVDILEGREISNPEMGASIQDLRDRKYAYKEAGSKISSGSKWLSESRTTSIHPLATRFREAGMLPLGERTLRLLAADVLSPRDRDPYAVFEYARILVGLDAESGDLMLEYLENLRPVPGAANEILTLHERKPIIGLMGLIQKSADDRTDFYEEIHSEMQSLYVALHERSDSITALGASG